jgi:2,5-diamino-6-(ribosylamino)-4(3H)-pyrimidinone 5'-phosphate reductase
LDTSRYRVFVAPIVASWSSNIDREHAQNKHHKGASTEHDHKLKCLGDDFLPMRPRVTVNCAMSPDGKIATREHRQIRISSPEDMERVRSLRASVDAILVGIGTILADDPHLTVKGLSPEKNPLRVVLDSNGRTPDGAKVVDGNSRTIIVTNEACTKTWTNVQVLRAGKDHVDFTVLMPRLYEMGIRTLLVEGGGEVIWSFFRAGMVDVYSVYVGSDILGGRGAPSPVDGEGFLEADRVHMDLRSVERLGEGVLLTYERLGPGCQ